MDEPQPQAQPLLPLPELSGAEYKFIDAYTQCRDAAKAAVEAGFQARSGNTIYRRPHVHAEIVRRMKNQEQETDKLIAKKRVVNVEVLDRHLMQVVTIPRKSLLETPSLATPKVNAIELGYRRIGLLMDDNFVPDAGSIAASDEAPRIFRPLSEQTIITHRITETREVVTAKVADAAPAPPPAPPTIEGEDPWKNF